MNLLTVINEANPLDRIKELGPNLRSAEVGEVDYRNNSLNGLYVFFSFDLVNSTAYKTRNIENWPSLFSHFYEYAREIMNEKFQGVQLWKYVGDEVLFFLKIREKQDLYFLCKKAVEVQSVVMDSINKSFPGSKGVLNIKSTIWSADVETIKSGNISTIKNETLTLEKNLIFFHSNQNGINFDFLGPDIDIGFRISKFSEKNKLVVSAELAFILYKLRAEYEDANNSTRIEEQLKIISFEDLKGIWNSRKYPIIWYHEDWQKKEDLFEYDEKFTSSLVRKIFDSDFELEPISFLQKVFSDTELNTKVTTIIDYLNDSGSIYPFDSKVISRKQAEVHCVSICITKDKKILIAKRQNKVKLNEKWEFGCGQIAMDQHFEESLKDVYKRDFNIEIDPLKEYSELIPISTYTYKNRDDIVVPGIIFTSLIVDEKKLIRIFKAEDNYSECELVTVERLNSIEDENAVPLFKENAQKAIITMEEKGWFTNSF